MVSFSYSISKGFGFESPSGQFNQKGYQGRGGCYLSSQAPFQVSLELSPQTMSSELSSHTISSELSAPGLAVALAVFFL